MTPRYLIENLSCGYGPTPALTIEALELRAGELTAIVGPNGAGKSTLIKALAGLLPTQAGRIVFDGVDLASLQDRVRARQIAYLPADARVAWPMLTDAIVALGRAPQLKPFQRLGEVDQTHISSAIERAGAGHLLQRRFDELSSGEKARILLAKALAVGADTLLLDEPAAALDPRHQLAIMALLQAEADAGRCVVFAGHSLEHVAAYARRVIVVDRGQVVADGPAQDALSPACLERVFGVTAPSGVPVLDWGLA